MPALFHEHYKVSYSPRGVASWLLYVLCLLAVPVVPLVVGMTVGNFWVRESYFMQIPNVRFTGRCVLRYTTVLGQEKLWTCSDAFNEKFLFAHEELGVLPFFSIHQNDRDSDGFVDVVTIVLGLPINDIGDGVQSMGPLSDMDAIDRVEFLPEFVYEVEKHIKVNMTGAPLLVFQHGDKKRTSVSVGGPLSALTEGDLLFHTTEPLIASSHVQYTRVYTDSPFDKVIGIDDVLNVPLFAKQYASRNQSLRFQPYTESTGGLALLRDENYNRVLGEDLGALGDFTWRISLRIPRAEVKRVPSISESLKWLWVQYFPFAFVLQWLLWWLRGVLVKSGLIGSMAIFHRGWRSS